MGKGEKRVKTGSELERVQLALALREADCSKEQQGGSSEPGDTASMGTGWHSHLHLQPE